VGPRPARAANSILAVWPSMCPRSAHPFHPHESPIHYVFMHSHAPMHSGPHDHTLTHMPTPHLHAHKHIPAHKHVHGYMHTHTHASPEKHIHIMSSFRLHLAIILVFVSLSVSVLCLCLCLCLCACVFAVMLAPCLLCYVCGSVFTRLEMHVQVHALPSTLLPALCPDHFHFPSHSLKPMPGHDQRQWADSGLLSGCCCRCY
jgi:hypothetical protein